MDTPSERLDLGAIAKLTFEAPDPERFPALRLAREALKSGGNAPTILNAANEVAVERFLAGAIGFLDIAETVEETLSRIPNAPLSALDDVHGFDAEARGIAAVIAEARSR
jgi:1-deoxy-D-xylulose-5-phosphate reductoisomerase